MAPACAHWYTRRRAHTHTNHFLWIKYNDGPDLVRDLPQLNPDFGIAVRFRNYWQQIHHTNYPVNLLEFERINFFKFELPRLHYICSGATVCSSCAAGTYLNTIGRYDTDPTDIYSALHPALLACGSLLFFLDKRNKSVVTGGSVCLTCPSNTYQGFKGYFQLGFKCFFSFFSAFRLINIQ